jgi:uncharacterized membrane protein
MKSIPLLLAAGSGFAIAAYFTLVFFRLLPPDARFIPAFCRMRSDTCRLVLRHRDGSLFGLPNSVLGMIYYLPLLYIGIKGPVEPLTQKMMLVSWLTVAVGLYLTYSLLARLKVVCPLCLASHLLNLVIAGLLTFGR